MPNRRVYGTANIRDALRDLYKDLERERADPITDMRLDELDWYIHSLTENIVDSTRTEDSMIR